MNSGKKSTVLDRKRQPPSSSQTKSLGLIIPVVVATIGLIISYQYRLISIAALLPWTFNDSFSSFLFRKVDVFDATHNITYRGIRSGDIEHFQNIFYAEDTSGKNRFAPPVPLVLEAGSVIDATHEGAWCPQGVGGPPLPFTSPVTNVSENCLSLRIARPKNLKKNVRLPVVVWMHGGGHALGSTSDVLYTPDGFVRRSVELGHPVIFVGINYRLGVFGFARNTALLKSKHTNAGLRDQRAALEWVKENIAIFGGDADAVTAIGQSVGASDIGLHLTSYGGKQGVPFQKAIMMSGATGLNFNTMGDLVSENTAAIARHFECGDEAAVESSKIVECLKELPLDTLMNVSVAMMRAARPPFGEAFFHPTFDNDYIPERPSELLRKGNFVKGIPIIASWVTNDGAWYAPPTTSTDEEVTNSFTLWMNGFKEDSLDELLRLYPLTEFEHLVSQESAISAQYYRAAQISRDLWFTCPVIDFTYQYAKFSAPEHVRIYEGNQTRFTPAYEMMGVPFWGVAHLSDIPYVLNVQNLGQFVKNNREELDMAAEVSARILSFVTTDKASLSTTGTAWQNWPPAYSGATQGSLKEDFPDNINLRLFGGPNDGNVNVSRSAPPETGAQQAVARERLFDRCDFINSAKGRKERDT